MCSLRRSSTANCCGAYVCGLAQAFYVSNNLIALLKYCIYLLGNEVSKNALKSSLMDGGQFQGKYYCCHFKDRAVKSR